MRANLVQTFNVPNLVQMTMDDVFVSFTLRSVQEKFERWNSDCLITLNESQQNLEPRETLRFPKNS